jgi:PAS domain S-box-containing protein
MVNDRMTSNFIQMQMDFIFFFYGLGFILLAAAAVGLTRTDKKRLHWNWLCLFGLLHGINEWFDLLALSLKDSPSFSVVRLIILTVSFLFLVEFGRTGSFAIRKKGLGRWIFIPLLLLAGIGALSGMSGLNAAVRYTLGLAGSLWAALALWRLRQNRHPESQSLLFAAISMVLYGLSSGVVVPQAPFFPANFLNQASFLYFTGFPIQLFRGVLACTVAAAIWKYYSMQRRAAIKGGSSSASHRYESWTIAAIVAVLAAGWIMTGLFGEFGRQRDRVQYTSDLTLLQRTFEGYVETANGLVQTMVSSQSLSSLWIGGPPDISAINSTLDRYARIIPDSICYVLDSTGTTLASSNRDTSSSFVGHCYAVRPYFKEAMEGVQGHSVAVGLTTKEPGYFTSYPVKDAFDGIVGVAVVKVNLNKMFSLPLLENYGFLVDANGIILSSTAPGFVLNSLRPIDEDVRLGLIQSKQFPEISESSVLPANSLPGTFFTLHGKVLQSFEQKTSVEGLSFVVLGSMDSWKMARLVGILISLLAAVLLVVFFVVNQRNREASERLTISERLYRTLVEGSPNWIGLFDQDGRCVAVNRNGLMAMGRTEDEILGNQFNDIWSLETVPILKDLVNRVRCGNRVTVEADQLRTDGSSMTWFMVMNPICEQDGIVRSFVTIASDITERKLAEDAIVRERNLSDNIINSMPGIFYKFDDQGKLVRWNTKFEEMSEYSQEELYGMHFTDFFSEAHQNNIVLRFQSVFAEGETFVEAPFLTKGGKQIPYFFTGRRTVLEGKPYLIGVGVDITERVRAEEEKDALQAQLLQAQKMDSVGRLAGGVAHDFNNMLSAIIGHAELAMMRSGSSDPIRSNLKAIVDSAYRSAGLTRQLLAFARKQTVAPKVMDINDTVAGMLKMLLRLIGENINVVWKPKAGVWRVRMDPTQVDQIFVNLCVNARDAIAGVGKVTIETENIAFDKAYCAVHHDVVCGEYVLLAVSDNGCGMSKEILDHLFEPFFTTKKMGMGTGLGLATVYGIVKQNEGFINVYSEPGKGTTFNIYLPRVVGEASMSADKSTPEMPKGHGETVLLVDDEQAILDVSQAMLKQLGYAVLVASTPGEALQIAEAHAAEIQMLITDVVLPEMNGRDLANLMGDIKPELKCLYISGYTASAIAHHGVLDDGVNFIQKPFSVRDMAVKVREVLDNTKSSTLE